MQNGKIKRWATAYSNLAYKQMQFFEKEKDFHSSMYWKGIWVQSQALLLELEKGSKGFDSSRFYRG